MLQTLIEIYNLYNAGKLEEAIAVQKKVSGPEYGIGTSDVSGMKWIIAQERGYPETSRDVRRPFPKFDDPAKKERVQKYVAPLIPFEQSLYSKN